MGLNRLFRKYAGALTRKQQEQRLEQLRASNELVASGMANVYLAHTLNDVSRVPRPTPHGGDYVMYKYLDEAGEPVRFDQCAKVVLQERTWKGEVLAEEVSLVDEHMRERMRAGQAEREYSGTLCGDTFCYGEIHYLDNSHDYTTRPNCEQYAIRVCSMDGKLLEEQWGASGRLAQPEEDEAPALNVLVHKTYLKQQHTIPIQIRKRAVIGRQTDCDIWLNDIAVSRQHCEIVRTPEGLFLRDLGSANGTLLNGNPVTEQMLVGDGDIISLGLTTLRLEVPLQAAEEPVNSGT